MAKAKPANTIPPHVVCGMVNKFLTAATYGPAPRQHVRHIQPKTGLICLYFCPGKHCAKCGWTEGKEVGSNALKVFRNLNWTKRDYECTNLVACEALEAPVGKWEECSRDVLAGLTKLHGATQNGSTVWFWGYL